MRHEIKVRKQYVNEVLDNGNGFDTDNDRELYLAFRKIRDHYDYYYNISVNTSLKHLIGVDSRMIPIEMVWTTRDKKQAYAKSGVHYLLIRADQLLKIKKKDKVTN